MEPHCTNVTGSPQQFNELIECIDHMITAIQVGHVSAIGSTSINTNLMYIINPQIYTDLEGKPVNIIGNAIDGKGEYC